MRKRGNQVDILRGRYGIKRLICLIGKRLIFSVLIVWLLILIYVSTFLFHASDDASGGGGSSGDADIASYSGHRRDSSDRGGAGGGGVGGEDLQRRLDEAMRELDAVKRQNRDLQKMALEIREARHVVAQEMKGDKVPEEVAGLRRRLERALKELEKASFSAGNILSLDPSKGGEGGSTSGRVPSSAHELARMRIENTVREANRFFVGQLKALKGKVDAASTAAASVAKKEADRRAKESRGGGGGEGAGVHRFTDPRAKLVSVDDQNNHPNSLSQHHRKFFKNDLVANHINNDVANLGGGNVDDDAANNGAISADSSSSVREASEATALLNRASSRLDSMLAIGSEHLRILVADLEAFRDLDGLGDWRRKEAQELSRIVQNKLEYLQNPKDCRTAKKLVCNLNKGCGYGCQLHHAVYCLVVAFASRRTLILESMGWRYHPDGGWDSVFQPISKTCLISNAALVALEKRANDSTANSDSFGDSTKSRRGFSPSRGRKKRVRTNIPWGAPSLHPDALEVEIPIIDSINPRPNQLPLAVPEDLRPRLERFHASPPVWWIGQLLKFLLKPKPKLSKLIKDAGDRLGFSHPIVGVHVRRTDKVGTEAAYHSIGEYMARVDDWFKKYELLHPSPLPSGRKRNVFLATDEPLLLEEAKAKFPDYNFVSDNNISKSAGLSSRYSEASLHGIILDIHFLAHSDFLVCTFSSQVCRVAYELMQTLHPDASEMFSSLDDIFYFGGQNAHNVQAVYAHESINDDEMPLQVGDLIGIAGNHWDGFSKGRNRRLEQNGLFPSYKVRDAVNWVPFPLYREADNLTMLP